MVLVIMAILAAAAIPTMMGYVDEAKASQHLAEARSVYVAATAALTEAYGKSTTGEIAESYEVDYTTADPTKLTDPVKKIYDMTVNGLGIKGKAVITSTKKGQVLTVTYNTQADGKAGYVVTLTFDKDGGESSAKAEKV